MKKILIIIIAITLLLSNMTIVQAKKKQTENQWPKCPEINADSAIVMELSSGLILYEKNKMKKEYPASITKIMTTLLCLENSSLNETVTFSKDAIFGIEVGSSAIGVDVGEKLTMKDALYAVMLASANEVAAGVAEHVAGSISSFSDMMNTKAKEIGCKNTHFINPHGLFDENHYTCAYDMALICREAFKLPAFQNITSTKQYQIPQTNKSKAPYWLSNHQQMLNPSKFPQYRYDTCIGGKTGYTQKARYTLVSFAKQGDMELVCVVMKADSPYASQNEYTDSIKLLDYAFANYKAYPTSALDVTDAIQSIPKRNPIFNRLNNLFNAKQTPIRIANSSYIILPKKAKLSNITQSISLTKTEQPKKDKNIIGTISYQYGGKIVGLADVVFDNQLAISPFQVTASKSNIIDEVLPAAPEITSDNSRQDLKLIIIGIIIGIIVICFIISNIIVYHSRRKKYSYYRNRKFHSNSFDDFFDL